jgi:hypothetical protein
VEPLPELAHVYGRRRVDEPTLTRSGRLWTLTTIAHTVPFMVAAVLLTVIAPITAPLALILVAHAWIIPELYAARGAGVVRLPHGHGRVGGRGGGGDGRAELRALGLLGDLVGHEARALQTRTGLVLERGVLGVWLVGETGAILVRTGGRRACCYCVKVTDRDLPAGDRIAHLLLALRADEAGFATVANLAFCGACWRLRRRLPKVRREALDQCVRAARSD